MTWTVTGTGNVQIEAKADIKVKLGGRSPNVADSLAKALAPSRRVKHHDLHGGRPARIGPTRFAVAFLILPK